MISKKYNLINNIGGWFVFIIALITYWLTLEPTASYWDCGEFIIQADKLEVGHPPGNPIFMLTARFFANFASSPETVSVMVNAMSGLLSALTILLLFWTITSLVRRLVVHDDQQGEISLQQYLVIMGSGLVGSLAYCWSDTFWFSAVEGEVYAFSSFCTALVFWLILKWENRVDEPHSDRYLILIAYIIGVSVAVHLLNLLCIPAIVLVYCYRKYEGMNVLKSLLALLVSFVIIVLVLYGLVPGFIKVAQQFELIFVNGFGCSFNTGTIIYALLTIAIFAWALCELNRQRDGKKMRISFIAAVAISGMLFFGSGIWIGLILLILLAAFLFSPYGKRVSVRMLNVAMWSIAVIFIGYSSYALILIRSSANTPMNQNAPDNVFDLASYLNREQYGENPLIYGETLFSSPMKQVSSYRTDSFPTQDQTLIWNTPQYTQVVEKGKPLYKKGVKGVEPKSEYGFLTDSDIASNAKNSARGGDYYVKYDYKPEAKMNPELNMLFPRIYSRMHRSEYANWVNLDTVPDNMVTLHAIDEATGEKVEELDVAAGPDYNEVSNMVYYHPKQGYRPTYAQNLTYFFNYQLNHMYMRYFMWNFAGRQNDILNQRGELDAGNWISGIPFIDNPRLGDQSLLPDDLGKGNRGHNVFYMLPLILGIIGLIWQAFAGRRGIEQFWVVFFLFFMTGIAIVLYLNQPPAQPRERDYAFAGSFYAYAIWIGMGVAGLWRIVLRLMKGKEKGKSPEVEELQLSCMTNEPASLSSKSKIAALVACVLGIVIPLQMVSQTWDDHDRSGRYAARDYAIDYLESLEPNAIVFCNGDNDTFPLWYAHEVEGIRPDVRILNLSYLNSDWYANQMLLPSYSSAPVKCTATPKDYAYSLRDVTVLGDEKGAIDLLTAIKEVYKNYGADIYGYPAFRSSTVYIPVDKKKVLERGLVAPDEADLIEDNIVIDLAGTDSYRSKGYISLGELLMLDIIATNAANGWERPIYWASTVGTEYHLGLTPYLRSTGMTHQLVPTIQAAMDSRPDRAYDVITKKYRWGGADKATADKSPYFDETASRMLTTVRSSMLDVADRLIYDGDNAFEKGNKALAQTDYKKALTSLELMENKLSEATRPYGVSISLTLGQLYCELGNESRLNDKKITKKGLDILSKSVDRYLPYVRYAQEMRKMFINPSFTIESTHIPYQLYRFIDLYQQFGGDMKSMEGKLKRYGLTSADLKRLYDSVYNQGQLDSATNGEGETPEQYAEELGKLAEIVNNLASLSESDYAAASGDERMIDSVYYQVLNIAKDEYGVTDEMLSKYPEVAKVDMGRSKRLNNIYILQHPDQVE
jgi:hypothetical protein